MGLCECGCGEETKPGKRFLRGHYSKTRKGEKRTINSEISSLKDQEIIVPLIEQKEINQTGELITDSQLDKKDEQIIIESEKPVPPIIEIEKENKTVVDTITPNINKKKMPVKLLSTDEIRKMHEESEIKKENLTDEQKFLRFFGNLPKWTEKKPGRIAKWLAQRKTGNKFDVKHVVFVEEQGQHKQAYIPYNHELGFLFTENGYWDYPINDAEPIFLDKKLFMPLINRKNLMSEFDLSEDYAASLINTGIDYAQLSQFKEVIAEIKSLKTIYTLALIVIFVVVLAIVLVTYIQNKHYTEVASNMFNLTLAVNKLG